MSHTDDRPQSPALRPDPEPVAAGPPTRTGTVRITPVISVLAVSALLMILNETVLSVVLPQLMNDFGVGATTVQWLTTGFMLTMAVVIPTTGFLLRRFTTRALFTTAIALFTVGTLLAALAPGFTAMLLARVVQACGTAIILPLLMATTLNHVPVAHRGTVMGLNSVVISVAPAVGPTVSGLIADTLGWRWVFGLMLAIAVLVLALGAVFVRLPDETGPAPLDVPSVVLSVPGFGGLVYGLGGLGALDGSASGALVPVAALAVGAVALALFVLRQRRLQRSGSPLLDLRPLGVGRFRISLVIVVVCMATMLGTVLVLPLHLQVGLGQSILVTGLLLLPGGLVQGVLSPLVGRLYDTVGPAPLVIPGALLLCGGQWWLSTADTDTGTGTVVAMHVVFCVGMAMLMTPLMTLSLSALPRELYGHGSAIMNTLQQLAGAAGVAVMVAAMSVGAAAAKTGDAALAQAAGTHQAFVLGGCAALVAVVCAPFVRRLPRAAEG
ncbi:DHA2 family efflux MFS transporter permease subunit [Nocardiopsis changdeensis]|uniref:DHA2 family efflux MFS transporter permease subunit n=1 Tax=Nocardiopsis changdeensis TaxID=2831969 RepID=A0ABX8BDU2_9ACTN|nr:MULTISPECIES: DHA2 family efflux MFS transporter permease subunit [Nocardiopsis]QUX20416.1 DHA2 family efflux MFS transporter permease subunit [Nocardiopsis changdeensis]QYX36346.1 DHA2 family efflux MFS transporter permease subunit [Nocardiopsis sp. MT53]